MDVFRATADYDPPPGCGGVIPLREGDFFEVLESEDYRYHKDWWGVRRTGDNAIGYVPAKLIKFEETRPDDVLPDDYQEQREMYVRQLQEMERMNLPDLYKMPPLTTKSYDDWRELDPDGETLAAVPPPDYDVDHPGNEPGNQAAALPHPCDNRTSYQFAANNPYANEDPAYGVEPDYSDSDSDDAKKPEVDKPDSAQPSRDSPALSEEDWARIVASADMEVGEAPVSPEPDLPEPDYQDENDERDEQDGNKKYKYKVILPAPDAGKFLGGDGSGSGVIQPKKLVNPVLQSKDHQKLHRELMLNQKMGIDVLHQKSELKQKYDDMKKKEARRLKAEEAKAAKNPFQLMLEERAEKLRLHEESQKSPTSPPGRSPTSPASKSPSTPKSPTSPKTAPKPSPKPGGSKTDQNQNEQSEFLRMHSKINRNVPS